MIAKMLTAENLTAILNKGAISSGGALIANMLRLTEIDTSRIFETLMRISPIKPVEFVIRLGESESAGGIQDGCAYYATSAANYLPPVASQTETNTIMTQRCYPFAVNHHESPVRAHHSGGVFQLPRGDLIADQLVMRLQKRLNSGRS